MAKAFTVEGVVERVAPDGKGGFTEVVSITFTMPQGFRGSVTIPKADATPEKAQAAIEAEVKKIAAIYAL